MAPLYWSLDCPSLEKNFYIEDPEVARMTSAEVAEIRRENNNISAKDLGEDDVRKGRKVPNPVTTFEHAFQHYRKYKTSKTNTAEGH